MADNDLNKDKAKEYLKSILETKDSMQELYALNRAYNVSLGKTEEYGKSINRQFGIQRALATEALKASRDSLRTEGDRVALARISNNIQETANDMLRSRAQTQADLLLKQIMIKEGLIDEYAEQAKNYKLLLDKNVITEEVYKRHLQQLKAEQNSVKHLKEHLEMDEAIAEKLLEIQQESEAWKHSLTKVFETAKAIGRDPKIFGAFMLTQMVEKVHEVYEGFEKLNQSGLTVGQRIDYMTKGFSMMSMVGLSDTKGVLDGMVETMGTMNSLTSSEVDHIGHLAIAMGVSGQEAFALVESFSKLPGETMATATHAADYVKSLAKANGVAPGKITKEIAKNTELIALGGYKGAKAFTDAAMKAQKMGVELSTTSSIMKGLLNFEDSINAQLEASVLLGKEINFDRARQLALEGKSVEATEEVLKNIGGQAEFDKMNVLQKEKLAAATGMTVEQMQKALDAQVEYNKYHGEDVSMWKEGAGYAMEWGGATLGFLKNNATALLSSIQLLGMITKSKLGEWAIDKARLAWDKTAAGVRKGLAMIGIGKSPAEGIVDKSKELSEKAGKVKTPAGGGIGKSLKDIAKGVASFGSGKVLAGALIMPVAAVGLLAMVASIPFLTFISFAGAPAGIGLTAFGKGLKAFGEAISKAAPQILIGIGVLALFGAALIPLTYALSLLSPLVDSFGKIIVGVFQAIPPIISAVADGFVRMFGAISENIGSLLMLGPALMMIGAGLGMMSLAGIGALPILGALTALAVVAPALTGLGTALGGLFDGGGGEESDKMDELIGEIKALRADMGKGGVINMDGKKVGEVLRLSVNSTSIR